ncbi:hypothetical protein KAW80_03320 [Candidatus Babeliales bacterium]|nr:hypothetical protein [Candidatus Babeliales bacterium]
MYCEYYQAKVVKNKIWFIIGNLKNEGPWCFTRALKEKNDILEFFVAPDYEDDFIRTIDLYKEKGFVLELFKLPNRLKTN